MLRRLGRVVYGVAAFAFLSWSMEQLFLSPPVFSKFFELAFGGQVHLSYRIAWSLWPGQVEVRGLEMRGEDDNVQWNLSIDEASIGVSLHELAARTFHATRVDGRGVGWALRLKQPLLEMSPEVLFGLPAIRGYGDMALKPYGPDELDTDATYGLWTVHLDQVTAQDVREIWIEKLHLMGRGQLTGGFFFKPVRVVSVMAQLQTDGLDLTIGDDAVARGLQGHLAITVHPFDPRQMHGRSVLTYLDLSAQLTGQSGDLGFIRRTLPSGESLRAAPGPLSLQFALEQGRLASGSSAQLGSPHLHAEWSGFGADTAVRADLTVSNSAEAAASAQADITVQLTEAALSHHQESEVLAQVAAARAELTSSQLDLASPLAWSALTASVTGARAKDLARFQELLPHSFPLRISRGRAEAQASLEATPQTAHGTLQFSIRDLTVRKDQPGARWSANGRLRLREHEFTGSAYDFSGSQLSIERSQRVKEAKTRWWGRLQWPLARVDMNSTTRLDMLGACLDASPLLPLLKAQGVPGFVANLFEMPGLTFESSLLLNSQRVALRDLHARGGSTKLLANYEVDRDHKLGEAFITLGHTSIGLDLDGGRARPVLIDATSWYADRVRSRRSRSRQTGRSPVALEQGHASSH